MSRTLSKASAILVSLASMAASDVRDVAQLVRQADSSLAAGRDMDAVDSLGRFVEALQKQPNGRSLIPEATRIAEAIQARNPGVFRAAFQYAELLFLAGRYSETLAALAKIGTGGHTNADYYNLAGMSYAGLNDLPLASRAVIKAIELAPGRPDLLVNLAGLYQRASNNNAALMALSKAVAMPSAPAAAFFALALTHYNLGNFQKAVEGCRETMVRDPSFDKAFLLMGRAYNAMATPAEARRAFARAAALNSACDACQFEMALLARSSAESERLLRATIAINPRHADAHYRLGKLLGGRNQTGGALRELERAVALDPDLDGAYYEIGALYRKRGEQQKAGEIFAALRARKEQRRAASEANLAKAQDDSRAAKP